MLLFCMSAVLTHWCALPLYVTFINKWYKTLSVSDYGVVSRKMENDMNIVLIKLPSGVKTNCSISTEKGLCQYYASFNIYVKYISCHITKLVVIDCDFFFWSTDMRALTTICLLMYLEKYADSIYLQETFILKVPTGSGSWFPFLQAAVRDTGTMSHPDDGGRLTSGGRVSQHAVFTGVPCLVREDAAASGWGRQGNRCSEGPWEKVTNKRLRQVWISLCFQRLVTEAVMVGFRRVRTHQIRGVKAGRLVKAI